MIRLSILGLELSVENCRAMENSSIGRLIADGKTAFRKRPIPIQEFRDLTSKIPPTPIVIGRFHRLAHVCRMVFPSD